MLIVRFLRVVSTFRLGESLLQRCVEVEFLGIPMVPIVRKFGVLALGAYRTQWRHIGPFDLDVPFRVNSTRLCTVPNQNS